MIRVVNKYCLMGKITIAKGDGIGPEILDAAFAIMNGTETNLEIAEV